ncbi:6-bladed beta-propeller [uncultured Proteiniphilum sp.]|uniref:6-bladed beta-propeller n=1 Tax=uncultured Proteiniphilum sp. TaxID=497637 RepID=UPI0026275D9D|nr:6-bladed beta-propeller [uncultured Proteiniphilum sp.]
MKKETTILAIILFITAGIGGCKRSGTQGDLITVDVTANYPKKELILQDFMDVEYIPLETNDEFVTQGDILAIGNKYILVKNWINDGDIFVFDRKTGKALRKINRRGQGAEEYNFINGIVLDEENNEIFVNCSPSKKIFVYDLSGNFKRSFAHTEGSDYWNIFNYDNDNLIRYDNSAYYKDGEPRGNQSYHAIISKQDGSITQNISIPFDVIKAPIVREGEGTATASVRPIIPYHDTWLLVETSSDTVYNYVPQKNKLIPFLVKTPSTDPEVFLTMGTLTDRFYFMQTMKKMFDFTTGRGFPINDLMYDKQENAIFNASVFNGDYAKKQEVDMTSHPVNSVIATFQNLAASHLVEAYENDELKGKLKEIAEKLNEEANPVIMLVKYKE